MLLTACIPIATSSRLDIKSRGNVPVNASTAVEVGKSSRSDVLLMLGEPDGRGPNDTWFSYGMTHSRTVGVIMISGAGGASILNESQTSRRLVIHFDADAIVTSAEVADKKCAYNSGSHSNPMQDCLDSTADLSQHFDPAELVRLMPDLADEHVQSLFATALWYGEVASTFARAQIKLKTESGRLVVFNKSLVFTRASSSESGTSTSRPPPVRIPYTEVASVEVGNFVLSRWVAVHTRDGHTHFFAVLTDLESGTIDRSQTQAAGDLLRSNLQTFGH